MAESTFGKLAEAAARKSDPEAREKVLRQAHALANEERTTKLMIHSHEVLAVARFLAGEPG